MDQRKDFICGLAQIEPDVGRDLVVARTPGMQPLAGIAEQVGEALLDIQMHILQIDRPGELFPADLPEDRVHAAFDVGKILGREHADRVQHARVGQRSSDIEPREALVELHRRGIALHQFRDRLAEPAGPDFAGVVRRFFLGLH